jgi:hypothetical protein
MSESKDRMISLLPYYLQNGSNINKYYEAIGRMFDEIIEVFIDIINSRDLDKSFGYGLDIIGGILGEPRNGVKDDTYTELLKTKIISNRSIGNAETLNDFGRLILEQYFQGIIESTTDPAKIILRYTFPLIPNSVQLLKKAVVAGVQVTDEIDSYVPICGTFSSGQYGLNRVLTQVGGGNTA